MKIEFLFKDDQSEGRSVLHSPSQLYYDAYIADFRIILDDARSIILPSGPALHFLTALQSILLECFLTRTSASTFLFETGARMSAKLMDEMIALEIPVSGGQLICPVSQFVVALRDATLEFLWKINDREPQLLSQRGLFAEGSIQAQAARLILAGKLPRSAQ